MEISLVLFVSRFNFLANVYSNQIVNKLFSNQIAMILLQPDITNVNLFNDRGKTNKWQILNGKIVCIYFVCENTNAILRTLEI